MWRWEVDKVRMTVDDLLNKAADCEARGKWLAALWWLNRALEAESKGGEG
jgi:hypothetical protein